MVYPRCSSARQHAMIQRWSRRLLAILHNKAALLRPAARASAEMHARREPCLLARHLRHQRAVPATFVAKAEIRGWPFLGKFCERTGTIFIERGTSRGRAPREPRDCTGLASGNTAVVVYPEGTTTLGRDLKPFRPALLQSAVDTSARIHPLALRYVDSQGRAHRRCGLGRQGHAACVHRCDSEATGNRA